MCSRICAATVSVSSRLRQYTIPLPSRRFLWGVGVGGGGGPGPCGAGHQIASKMGAPGQAEEAAQELGAGVRVPCVAPAGSRGPASVNRQTVGRQTEQGTRVKAGGSRQQARKVERESWLLEHRNALIERRRA